MSKTEAVRQLISDVGKKIASCKTCPNKDLLVKLLKQVSNAFAELKQSPTLDDVVKPLSDSLVKHSLLQHKDKDVRLLVALCICEIARVLAPNPGFDDAVLRDIFKLFLSVFKELADTSSPFLSRRVKLLETVCKLNFCVLLLDIGSEDLVLEIFTVFFMVVREQHPQSLFSAMASIMGMILKEKTKLLKKTLSEPLVDVILQNMLKEAKGIHPASFRLAVYVIQNFMVELQPFIVRFLTSCITNRDVVDSELKERYHDLIFEIFQCAPQILLAVIPSLTQELLTDQVDVRIKAVNLLGRIFALPGHNITQDYHHVFLEFLNRFSDKSAEVRLSAITSGKAFYMSNPSGTESFEVLTSIKDRLLDFEDRVRTQAVTVVCDLVRYNSKSAPSGLITQATERLRDKMVSVRKKALQKLVEVYHDYCIKCSGGVMALNKDYEQIPCKILMLCYDKDCKEFGPQNMELVISENLFPSSLSIEDRTVHWVYLFSLFSPPHIKALNIVLSQKRRLQTEMQAYLALRKNKENIGSSELEKKIQLSFVKMSATFPDPLQAKECFSKLNAVKDEEIFTELEHVLDGMAIQDAQSVKSSFLRRIGNKSQQFAFLQLLSTKCFCNIFTFEHVSCIVDRLSSDRYGSIHLGDSAVKLLLTIIGTYPSLLRGSERKFCLLVMEEDIPFNKELIQILVKAGPHSSIMLSDVYPLLERICLEGTRSQSKVAVSAIAVLSTSKHSVFNDLCKALVASLYSRQNVPTVLQSLGCIARYSISSFEENAMEINQYIHDNIFRVADEGNSDGLRKFDEGSDCGSLCQLKVFGLKTIVKSFLPYQNASVNQNINSLLDLVLEMLQKGETSGGTLPCESDKAKIRLAAAKSVLRLSRRWDLHITPQIFQFTILMAKDPHVLLRRSLVVKAHKLFKERMLPSRYACVFTIVASDSPSDIKDSSRYLAEFIREYHKRVKMHQTSEIKGAFEDPAYIVVFLIYVLAHDPSFPPKEFLNEEILAQFCSPIVLSLRAFLDVSSVNGNVDLVNNSLSCLESILYAIKRVEDAVDSQFTAKLHAIADFAVSILNTLKRGSKYVSSATGLVFLPSSMYRALVTEKQEANTNPPALCDQSNNGTDKLIDNVEGKFFPPGSTSSKVGKKDHKSSLQPFAAGCKRLNLSKKVDSSVSGLRERSSGLPVQQDKLQARGNQMKNAVSKQKANVLFTSMELHSEFSSVNDERDGLRSYKSVSRNEQLLSSCNSATTASLPSERDVLTYESSSFHNLPLCHLVDSSVSSEGATENGDLSSHEKDHLPVQKKSFSNKKIPLTVNAGKREKISFESSSSEIISVNDDSIARRTRRRK